MGMYVGGIIRCDILSCSRLGGYVLIGVGGGCLAGVWENCAQHTVYSNVHHHLLYAIDAHAGVCVWLCGYLSMSGSEQV